MAHSFDDKIIIIRTGHDASSYDHHFLLNNFILFTDSAILNPWKSL